MMSHMSSERGRCDLVFAAPSVDCNAPTKDEVRHRPHPGRHPSGGLLLDASMLLGIARNRAGFFAFESVSDRDIREDIGVRDVP